MHKRTYWCSYGYESKFLEVLSSVLSYSYCDLINISFINYSTDILHVAIATDCLFFTACYGIITVPSGPWFCRKCESQERAAKVVCIMCISVNIATFCAT